jgi:hypothetical protein
MNDNQSLDNNSLERAKLGFREEALQAFSFLKNMGFVEVSSSPTIVKYERVDLEVNVYHGRQSYEVEFEIFHAGKRYSLSELIRLAAPAEGELYRNSVATTAIAVRDGINRVRELVRQYAMTSLQGDPETFHALDRQRNEWAEALALKTLVTSLKPKAEEAFRRGHYAQAAEIYDRIRAGLSPVEVRKADLARERATRATSRLKGLE